MLHSKMLCILFLYLATLHLMSCQDCDVLEVPEKFCPNETVTITCNTTDTTDNGDLTTFWNLNEQRVCGVSHSSSGTTQCGDNFMGEYGGDAIDTCYRVTLTGRITDDSVFVECLSNPVGPTPQVIDNATLTAINSVQTTAVTCTCYDNNTRNLNISWNTEDDTDRVSSYVVTLLLVDPPGTVMQYSITQGMPGFSEKQYQLEVEVGTEYTVSVRTDNCDDSLQGMPASQTVLLDVPPTPDCFIGKDNILIWNVVDVDICYGGSIENYTIFLENGTVIKVSPSDSCNETKCEYTDLDQDTMVISMAAENIIGLSGKGECMVEEDCKYEDLFIGVPSLMPDIRKDIYKNNLTIQVPCMFPEGSVSANGNITGSIANYTISAAYCVNDTELQPPISVECIGLGVWNDTIFFEKVAKEEFLEDWNIALIVIGVIAFLLEDATAATLGTMLYTRADTFMDGTLGLVMMIVSIVFVLPVGGPVVLATYIIIKKTKKDEKGVKMKVWYRMLSVIAVVMKMAALLIWLVQAGYTAENDFYGDGPLRKDNGICKSHDANTLQKSVQDMLVVLSFVLSVLSAVLTHLKASLWIKGTSQEGTDGTSKLPGKADQELETYETLQHPHKQPSSPQPLLSAGDPTYGHLNAQQQQQQEEEEQQYDHVQREKKKAVPNVNDPNYSHFASGGAGGQHYGKLDHGTGTGKGGTLPGSVPPATDEYGKLDKNRGGGEEYAVVTNEARHKPKKTGH